MNYRIYNSLNRWAGLVLLIFVAVLLFAATPQALAQQKGEAQGIVDKALITLNGFMNDKDYTWLKNNLNRAEGILIFPQVLKAGFILGGSGGTGVLLAKDEKGTWSQPYWDKSLQFTTEKCTVLFSTITFRPHPHAPTAR